MLYDLSNIADLTRCDFILKKYKDEGCVIELKKKQKRTLQQNNYLHLILSWFAIETGYTVEYVKKEYFKKLCNRELFEVEVRGKFGAVKDYRSSADLNSGELTTAIDRFRDWSANEGNIYLPSPNEEKFLQQIEVEISKKQRWL
jgi:hypothetical protein